VAGAVGYHFYPKAVAWYCFDVALISLALLFWLPGLAGAALVVFVPAVIAVLMIARAGGRSELRARLFNRRVWRLTLKWLLISLGVALGLRLGVSLLALAVAPGYTFNPGPFSPLLLATLIFAAGEEIGWRGFALPVLLENGYHPLRASLILGLPWALLHLPLTLPGMLSEGTPMVAELIIIMALSVLLSWAFLGSGFTLTAPILLHAGQNIFVILNNGMDAVTAGWLMAAVYSAAALVVVLLTRGRLGHPNPSQS